MITNPILPGFHPDPSFLRVGEDYYVATSTFEWFPGVPVYHSRDLVHWRLAAHALTLRSQLDLRGVGDSSGVWAPSLSHHDGKFWLVYTIVRTRESNFKDVKNYLITAEQIEGPWSEPVFLNATGFDPSLFHDDYGRKWLVQIQWDFRKNQPRFAGIVLQEYDAKSERLVGAPRTILRKKELIEGPNIYRRGEYYYLMLAEGGTGWNHGISMARARAIEGPYELDPQGSVMTSRDDESLLLQKAGHGEIVETPAGEWYLAHLASRPVGEGESRRCILGRETCLQKVNWSDDGWLRLAEGGTAPRVTVSAPHEGPLFPWPMASDRDDFAAPVLAPVWQTLRIPADSSWLSLDERPGWLRLRGRESLHSLFDQSLVAQRLTFFRGVAETALEFQPSHFTQMAGLVCWYDTKTHYYLRVTFDEVLGRVLGIVRTDDTVYDELLDAQIAVGEWDRVFLRAGFDRETLQFHASPDGDCWQPMGPSLDFTKLSDDYGRGLHFTGAFVGLAAHDLNGTSAPADFDYFTLRPEPS